VVDVGAGVGVLSIYAAQAGARRVYAIERAVPRPQLQAVLQENGVADRVSVLHADSRQVELPEPADVLLAEIGLDEEALLDARRRFLRPEGIALPERVTFCMAPVHAPGAYERLVDFWQGPRCSIQLSAMRRFAVNQVHRTSLEGVSLLADPAVVLTTRPATIEAPFCSGTARFTLRSGGVVHGFAGWHRIELASDLAYDNAPPAPAGGWAHNFFPFDRPWSGAEDSELELSVTKRGTIWTWRGRRDRHPFEYSTFMNVPLNNDA